MLLEKSNGGRPSAGLACEGLDDPALDAALPAVQVAQLREEVEMARGLCPEFSLQSYREGHMTPVFFGSALNNFGVTELLQGLVDLAPSPTPQSTATRTVAPDEDKVTGFVFKVQANMDRNHRDRVAFLRVCSGHFQRGMKLRQVRTGKDIVVRSPVFFMARDREIAEDAHPGDVIGIPNHGTVRVGDTFTEGESFRFTGLPVFAPENLRRVRQVDPSRTKQLRRALEDLSEEGLIQVFKPTVGSQWIVGVVGVLQLDVLAARARQEYRVDIEFETVPYSAARWLRSEDGQALKTFIRTHAGKVVCDRDDHPVFLAEGQWEIDHNVKNNEAIEFLKTKELL